MKAAILALVVLAGCAPTPPTCKQLKERSAITERAAQICVTELVGCSLTFEDVQAVVKAKRVAEQCGG